MDSADLTVLRKALQWCEAGHEVVLYTVVQTWGSAPRPVGSLLALRGDGLVEGSVSGGCIEDDLLARLPSRSSTPQRCQVITYGVSREESARFGLPCGGTLRLVEEPLREWQWIEELLNACSRHSRLIRSLDLHDGSVGLSRATTHSTLHFDGKRLQAPFGPTWRLMLIGAGQLSRYAADMAVGLGFEVLICDPREGYRHDWESSPARFVGGMPDDAVLHIEPDERTAVVALTHDPRWDDMALLTALQSPAFYIGALGSSSNNDKRRERLRSLGLSSAQVSRLQGPIGLPIGSRTPAEIALSLLAELVALRNKELGRQTSAAGLYEQAS